MLLLFRSDVGDHSHRAHLVILRNLANSKPARTLTPNSARWTHKPGTGPNNNNNNSSNNNHNSNNSDWNNSRTLLGLEPCAVAW